MFETVELHLGDSVGGFQAPIDWIPLGTLFAHDPAMMAGGDLDDDGDPDVLLASEYGYAAWAAGGRRGEFRPCRATPVPWNRRDRHRRCAGAGLTVLRNQSPGWAWTDLGQALAGAQTPPPHLAGTGNITAGTMLTLSLTGASPLAPAVLFAGFTTLYAPFKGGVFVPEPQFAVPFEPTDGAASIVKTGTCPPGLPSGLQVAFQYWIVDSGRPMGFTASNGLVCESPREAARG